jgi:hypothetical protein
MCLLEGVCGQGCHSGVFKGMDMTFGATIVQVGGLSRTGPSGRRWFVCQTHPYDSIIEPRQVFDAYPGYSGPRPKMQVLHGTNDTVLYPPNFTEEIKQWTTVLGLTNVTREATEDTPLPGWTKYSYGEKFEAYSAAGVDHDIPNQGDLVLDFFDLKCNSTERPCYSQLSS